MLAGQATRAGVTLSSFLQGLWAWEGWGLPRAQTSSPAHPLFCISQGTWISGNLSVRGGCVAWGQPLAPSGPHSLHLNPKGLSIDHL